MKPIWQTVVLCNTFSSVRFDTNRYSVPDEFVVKELTVKAGVFKISIWHRGKLNATTSRNEKACSTNWSTIVRCWRKPRAVWSAQPVKTIGLPSAVWDFATKVCNNYEDIKLLKFLAQHGLPALVVGMETAASVGSYAYEAVRTKLDQGPYTTRRTSPGSNQASGPFGV